MKHVKASSSRSRAPIDIYYIRILEMMRDYDISMKEAIEWDFDGFMPCPQRGVILTPEEEIEFYLFINYIPEKALKFFQGIVLGYTPDYELINEKPVEKENKGSPTQT